MLSSPSPPPVPVSDASPTFEDMLGLPPTFESVLGIDEHSDHSDSSAEDVEMQLTQAQSHGSSSHGSVPTPIGSRRGSVVKSKGKGKERASRHVWQGESSFRIRNGSPKVAVKAEPDASSVPRSASRLHSQGVDQEERRARSGSQTSQSQSQSQNFPRSQSFSQANDYRFSQMPLQTQAPYFSQSIDSQDYSQ